MARSDTRYSVYPAPKAVEVVGSSAPALNQAIECWAALLTRATADNEKTLSQGERIIADVRIGLKEWSFLAHALKDRPFDPDYANPGDLLATAVEDAHRFECHLTHKFFETGTDIENIPKEADADVKRLVGTLRELDYSHAWAVIVAVRWFWDYHDEGIDIEKDPWWTLAFRRRWHQKHSGNKHEAATTDRQREGKRRNRKPPSNQ
jgi:hypothetical protein